MLDVASAFGWIVLALFSLRSERSLIHTSVWRNVAHAMAYFLVAAVTRFSFQDTRSRWQVVAFSAAAAFFAIRQISSAGRSAAWRNWAAGSVGAFFGIILVKWLLEGTVL